VGLHYGGLVGSRKPSEVPTSTLEGVWAVSTSGYHTLFIQHPFRSGLAFAAGTNKKGQLGDGTTIQRDEPVKVISGIKAVAAGGLHSVFLRADGTAWTTGWNMNGQLGDGSTISRSQPIAVLDNVEAIAAGAAHTLFLRADGTVWAAGLNDNGQLGVGTPNGSQSTPLQVLTGLPGVPFSTSMIAPILTGVTGIAAGASHSLFLRSDRTAWAVGYNYHGQLGDGTFEDRSLPVPVFGLPEVFSVTAGSKHSLFMGMDSSAYTVGSNSHGQLADGQTAASDAARSRPVRVLSGGVYQISAGDTHSIFFLSNGTAVAAGHNLYDQLGEGVREDNVLSPTQVFRDLFPMVKSTTTTTSTYETRRRNRRRRLESNSSKSSVDDGEQAKEEPGTASQDGPPPGYVAGGIAVAVIWFVVFAACCWCLRTRRRRKFYNVFKVADIPAKSVEADSGATERPAEAPQQDALSWRIKAKLKNEEEHEAREGHLHDTDTEQRMLDAASVERQDGSACSPVHAGNREFIPGPPLPELGACAEKTKERHGWKPGYGPPAAIAKAAEPSR
jgi:alpha-tubulin suppressor-like RCC1 family protein